MTTLLGGLLMAAGVFLSSYARTLSSFMTFYSLMFGIGVVLAYTAPMSAGWAWLPKSKGLVSGIILCLYGAGGFIFNLVGTKLVNSEGFNLVDGRFPDIVYDRFYGMIRKLALIYGALVVTGAFLIKDPPKAPAVSSSGQKKSLHGYLNKKHRNVATSQNSNGVGPMAAMKTKQFWLLWLMCLTSTSAGLNVASVYKQFASGKSALSGDGYQAITGALGALFNAVGRLAWGLVIDKVGCKNSFLALSAGQALLYLFFTRLTSSKLSFTAVICACYFLLAGNFALAPPAIQRLFGPEHGTLIYGLVYSAFGLAAIGGSMITKQLMANFGWDGVFKVLAALSLFATFVTSMLSPISFYPGSSV